MTRAIIDKPKHALTKGKGPRPDTPVSPRAPVCGRIPDQLDKFLAVHPPGGKLRGKIR
ncbi:MAG: hypothetical protein IIC07_06190 [Proteobacteria bacterium]|nr:hypothetical protein [Pseudomonadota bacterium]